ncbi:MAG: CoA pyrophosphatase [Spirochaetales bacterium]|nr:CoA pyrophosphatase [Spirochaetales bacterium]
MADESYRKIVELLKRDFTACGNRIIGSEEAFKSAVLVPFIEIDGEECILFEKRAEGIRQGGEICLPGGMVDEVDETSIETVIRETIEETGITEEVISVHESAGYLITGIGALIDVYLGHINVTSLDDFNPNPDEVQRLFTIPVSFFTQNEPEFYNYRLTCEPWYEDKEGSRVDLFPAEELGLPERYWQPWSHRKNRFVVYKYDGEVIWGITARILYTISKLLRKSIS